MPILFNQSNDDTLISIISCEVEKVTKNDKSGWTFYVITCYFNSQAAEDLIKKIFKVLEYGLQDVHILIDINEYIKANIDKNEFIEKISAVTNLPIQNISLTPIDYNGKLFHAKSYALIKNSLSIESSNNGFAIITSGNLTQSGMRNNIEIGEIVNDYDSLSNFVKLFFELKENYAITPEKEAELQEFKLAVQFLSQGVFYHAWHPSFDLIFRLQLSPEERKRLRNLANNEETQKKIENFIVKEIKQIHQKPINIQSIFDISPSPIPKDFWGTYSIDTLEGQWVPLEISKLIDKEVEESLKILIPILKDLGQPAKVKEHTKQLIDYITRKIKENVIDTSDLNLSAINAWNTKVNKFFKDTNLLNAFICKYEKKSRVLDKMERKEIILLYQRIKDFYYDSERHIRLGKAFAESEDDINLIPQLNNRSQQLEQKIKTLVVNAEKRLQKNRLGELYNLYYNENKDKINKNDDFIALEIIVEYNSDLIQKSIEYKIVKGIFIGLNRDNKDMNKSTIIYKIDIISEEKNIKIEDIKTFIKIKKHKYNNNEANKYE